jgi:hypothetical protein
MSTPRSIFSRAVRPNLISLAAMMKTPEQIAHWTVWMNETIRR